MSSTNKLKFDMNPFFIVKVSLFFVGRLIKNNHNLKVNFLNLALCLDRDVTLRLRDELLRYSDNKKICIAFLRDKANPLVKGNHLIRAIERNLVAIQSFAQLYQSLNNPRHKSI